MTFVEAPYAGMEHQGAIAIGDVYESDSTYQVYEGYSFLLIHEAAHEWWGNSVAVGDMADVWINEGFAMYHYNDDVFFIMIKEFYDRYKTKIVSSQDFIDHAQPPGRKCIWGVLKIFTWPVHSPCSLGSIPTMHSHITSPGWYLNKNLLHSMTCCFVFNNSFA